MGVVPITPVDVTIGSTLAYVDIDLDNSISGLGANVTGAIIHVLNKHLSSNLTFGVRCNGSSDARERTVGAYSHSWFMIGVDSSHIFEAYTSSTGDLEIWLVGYTTEGCKYQVNAIDKSYSTWGSWQDISNSEAAGAHAIIYEWNIISTGQENIGMRCNGSTDNRTNTSLQKSGLGCVIGCDSGQVVEGYIGSSKCDMWLQGWIWDQSVIMQLNGTDVSLGSTGSYSDLSALPANATIGFFEVVTTSTSAYFHIRKNGSSEDKYYKSNMHCWAIVECDTAQLCEGKINSTYTDFFVVGYVKVETARNSVALIGGGYII